MARCRVALVLLILCSLIFSACTIRAEQSSPENLFIEDLDSIVADIQAMYDKAEADFPYEPSLYIAFADITFDGIPEFFYGYQAITSRQGKIWYMAYSLSDCVMIEAEHPPNWSTYMSWDTDCAFFTGSDHFMEGYYLNSQPDPCFVTKACAGGVLDGRADYVFIEYVNSKLSISTGFECDKELLEIKQIWSPADIANIKDEIANLLEKYNALP